MKNDFVFICNYQMPLQTFQFTDSIISLVLKSHTHILSSQMYLNSYEDMKLGSLESAWLCLNGAYFSEIISSVKITYNHLQVSPVRPQRKPA